MYYKLLNKNLITALLVSLVSLGAAKSSSAQGVVSLVEENNVTAPTNGSENTAAPSADLVMDTSLPDTMPESNEAIPLDNGLISPAPKTNPVKNTNVEPAQGNETNSNAPEKALTPEAEVLPAEMTKEQNANADFLLGVENDDIIASQNDEENVEEIEQQIVVTEQKELPANQSKKFGDGVLSKVNNDLFSQMSDIEKQTTLLTLELRREKVRNEIEAIKAQRNKAVQEKLAAEEEKKRKEFEWKKEQEAKVLREQQLLKEKEIELEKLKQKKALNAYMNNMLAQKQQWIADNAEIYKQMRQVEEDRKNLADNFKKKLENLTTLSNKVAQSANNAKSNHDRTLASLTAQNIQLKKRLEAEELAAKNRQQNPFSDNQEGSSNVPVSTSVDVKITPVNISKEYAIMEIIGHGDNLVAKLINKDGESFLARKGTVLQTGHSIEEITPKYIQFDRNGLKDYLYTSGSALTMEPDNMDGTGTLSASKSAPLSKPIEKNSSGSIPSTKGIPSLGSGMFVK